MNWMRHILIVLFVSVLLLPSCKAQNAHIQVGDTLPFFSLKDQNDSLFVVQDYIGKKILVIYFYPKDESMVCTKEACAFRDSYVDFEEAGAMVVGINNGTVKSHKAFAEHHNLPFILLSDPGNKVLKQFGVKDKFSITGRETFVIDLSGKVMYYFDAFAQGNGHSEKAIEFIKHIK